MSFLHVSGWLCCARRIGGSLAGLLLLAACHDLPSGPTAAADGTPPSAGGLHRGEVPAHCTLWRRAPSPGSGWQTRLDTLHFPRPELDAAGRTVAYRLYARSSQGVLLFAAECKAPYTEAALRRVDRRFGVTSGGGAEQFHSRKGMITIQGCVSEGECQLEPIVVVAPPEEDHDEYDPCDLDPASCGEDGWSGGDSGGSSGGSGGPSSPPENDGCTFDVNGSICESESRPECERDPAAPQECVTRFPTSTEWEALGRIIERMTEETDYCRGAKAIARSMYAAGREGGRIVLWDGRNYKEGTNQQEMIWGKNGADSRGRIMQLDSYLAFAARSLPAHEALHAYLDSINWPGTLGEQHTWIGEREGECAG